MKARDILEFFSFRRLLIPIIIGLFVTIYLVYDSKEHFESFSWGSISLFSILIALSMMVIRDLAYMYRIRVLTDNQISWRNSFDTIMLWEFASAITPSVVGGSGIAVYILFKEGVSLGRSTAVVMITAMLDELFYVLMVPIVIFFVGVSNLFPLEMSKTIAGFSIEAKQIFLLGYSVIVALTIIISFSIFITPQFVKTVLLKLFSFAVLKKWKVKAEKTGNDIVATSNELKAKPIIFWLKAFGATFFSWTARFWVVNFIITAFCSLSMHNHFEVYARQLVMWVIMLISPTPGGSGIAEFVFSGFLRDFIPVGLPIMMAVLWRIISYYPYLIIGVGVLPNWIKRTYYGRKIVKFKAKES